MQRRAIDVVGCKFGIILAIESIFENDFPFWRRRAIVGFRDRELFAAIHQIANVVSRRKMAIDLEMRVFQIKSECELERLWNVQFNKYFSQHFSDCASLIDNNGFDIVVQKMDFAEQRRVCLDASYFPGRGGRSSGSFL